MRTEDLRALLEGALELWPYLEEARRLKEAVFGVRIETCAILNAKSGRCPSDCKFCAQSQLWSTKAPVYPLLSEEELFQAAEKAFKAGIDRFSFVVSGIKLGAKDLERLLRVIERLRKTYPEGRWCASLGQLDRTALEELKAAGLSRYHHNLETAPSFYPRISSRQNWWDRLRTAERVKEAGLSLCCGGLFGLGEPEEAVLELAQILRDLEVDSVPVNFLHPIPGTPLEGACYLSPQKCLRILVALRFILPQAELRLCGGREYNLRELQALALFPANALMVGNYLTTQGRNLAQDARLIQDLGYKSNLKV